MEQSTIVIIIVAAALLLYATEVIPIVVTSILAVAAMVLTGVLTPAQAFSGFSNTTTLLAGTAMAISVALAETGAAEFMSRKLSVVAKMSKRTFNTFLCAVSALLSAFMSSLSIILIMMAVVDSIIAREGGTYNRRETYMPIAFGASIGGGITLSGSSCVLAACSVYNQYVGYDAISYAGPAILAIPATIGAILFYATFGTKLSEKWFDFQEVPVDTKPKIAEAQSGGGKVPTKLYISFFTFVVCAVLWATTSLNMALVGMLGCCVCFLTGCSEPDHTFAKMSWSTLIILATTLGFASGVSESGADLVMANALISICGPLSSSPTGMFFVLLLLTVLLTNIMSNTGVAVIVAPIAISVAETLGCDARLWVIAVGVGANCAIFTPIGCGCMTVLLPVGYRFKDFVKPGLVVCAISMALMVITFMIVS